MRIPLRIFLSLVIVAALMPPLVLLAMVVVRTAESDRAAAHTSLVDNAKVIASMVHGAIVSDAQVLGTIGGHVNEGPLEHANELELIGEHFRGDAVIVTSSPPTPSRPEWSVSNLVDIRPGERANLVFTVPLNEDTGDVLQVTADSTAVSSKISFGTLQNQMLVAPALPRQLKTSASACRPGKPCSRSAPLPAALMQLPLTAHQSASASLRLKARPVGWWSLGFPKRSSMRAGKTR